MTIKFQIGDRVMYHPESKKPQAGNIKDITYDEVGKPTGYLIKLDNEQMVTCNIAQVAHYDLKKL
jgi:hypothetical protein